MAHSSFPNWRALHAERLAEAVEILAAVTGVRALLLGGSIARSEHWPLSDIDLFPIWRRGQIDDRAMAEAQARLVDWWAASGRAQTLDVGWIRFDDAEAGAAAAEGAGHAAAAISNLRWFHGLDKLYGGRAVHDPDGTGAAFSAWVNRVRFDPVVTAARADRWLGLVQEARGQAWIAHGAGDPVEATIQLRAAARGLRLVLLESWGERLGSMGREWTLWEQMARQRGAGPIADRLAHLASAEVEGALARAAQSPVWLKERIRLAWEARQLIEEPVTESQSARDQLAAFAVHVARRRSAPYDAWLRIPEPDLPVRLAELDALMVEVEMVRRAGSVQGEG